MRMRPGIVLAVHVQASPAQSMAKSPLTAFDIWSAHPRITMPHSRTLS